MMKSWAVLKKIAENNYKKTAFNCCLLKKESQNPEIYDIFKKIIKFLALPILSSLYFFRLF